MSYDFFALKLSRREYKLLVRLLGHHTIGGGGLERVYNELMDGRPSVAQMALNEGPLCEDMPLVAKVWYDKRPMVDVK